MEKRGPLTVSVLTHPIRGGLRAAAQPECKSSSIEGQGAQEKIEPQGGRLEAAMGTACGWGARCHLFLTSVWASLWSRSFCSCHHVGRRYV